ncbi:helix-turn-helix domain-containing protein [Martelella mediterranea]|uniref:Nlp family transcriptional regulator n=1 Tax=Martelella mediterranea TaxID=293089 RepID=A0A4R3NUZ9_9HYPH|nr:helix-turn-helix domain-containing protein [Martelella mediterranea]TCT37465.1 Nlp family transcriptional regulator [Martelella mediterranea]
MSKPTNWTWKRILWQIHERGMTLEQLALRNGRNPNSFRKVSRQKNSIDQQIIADFIGADAKELWPDRYPQTKSRIYDSRKWGPLESQKSDDVSDSRRAA